MVVVRRVDPKDAFSDFVNSINQRVKSIETAPSGNIVIRQTLTTTDPNTGVSTVFGLLPDGTYGLLPFVNDTVPPPVPSTPTVATAMGAAVVTWDGTFTGGQTAPLDFEFCNIYGKMTGGAQVLVGTVRNAGDSAVAGANLVNAGDTWTFWATSVDFNGNESAPGGSTPATRIASVLDDTGLAQKLADNQAAIDQAQADVSANTDLIAKKSSISSQSTAPTGAHSGDYWIDTSSGNKPMFYDGTQWVSVQDQAASQPSADGKSTIYYSPTQPTGGTYIAGDTWFDSDDGYKIYGYDGTQWVSSQLGSSALADQSITNAKIADATISSAKISQLDAGKITTGTMDAARITAQTITASQIASQTITAGQLSANSVTAYQLSALSVTASAIAANTITAAQIQAGTITANEIAAGTITANKIVAGTITGDRLAVGTITSTQLAANSVTASEITAGAIDGMIVTGATLQTQASSNQGLKFTTSNGIKGYAGYTSSFSYGSIIFSVDQDSGRVDMRDRLVVGGSRVIGASAPGVAVVPPGVASGGSSTTDVGVYFNLEASTIQTGSAMISVASPSSGASTPLYLKGYYGGNVRVEKAIDNASGSMISFNTGGGLKDLEQWSPGAVKISGTSGLRTQYNGSTASANVSLVDTGTAGWYIFGVVGSARRLKNAIETVPDDWAEKLLNVEPRTWFDKISTERYAEYLSRVDAFGPDPDPSTLEMVGPLTRIPGLVAEEVEDAGLDAYVTYTYDRETGEKTVESISYDRLWTLLIPLVKNQRDRIAALEKLVNKVS